MTDNDQKPSSDVSSSWGRTLFFVTLAASAVFFWWLLIYSHGVTVHHG